MTEWSICHETKKKHRHKGCGWLASRRGSDYKNNSTSLQRMWLASSRRGSKYGKKHIVAKDVVGLQVGDDDSLTKIKTY